MSIGSETTSGGDGCVKTYGGDEVGGCAYNHVDGVVYTKINLSGKVSANTESYDETSDYQVTSIKSNSETPYTKIERQEIFPNRKQRWR
jgi:hypothetical protein